MRCGAGTPNRAKSLTVKKWGACVLGETVLQPPFQCVAEEEKWARVWDTDYSDEPIFFTGDIHYFIPHFASLFK